MSADRPPRLDELPPPLVACVDRVCDRFESAWKAGARPRVEDYLDAIDETGRPALLRELLALDLELHQERGECPTPNESIGRPLGEAAADQHLRRREGTQGLRSPPTPIQPTVTASEPTLVAAPSAPELPSLEGLEILEILGHGGMGVVYKARQTELDRLVAVKMIRAGRHTNPSEVSRFRREAESIARLHHPNIVQIYEVGEQAGTPYVVLEFVDGCSLAEQLKGTPLPARRAAELALALARATQHAHECGVLHRDLKPANVLVTPDGTLKIADFGLARRLDLVGPGETRTGAILGTPSYMAPEQAEGRVHDLGPAADTYALGAILYEVLTGRPPFRAASVIETLDQVRTCDPVPPTALQPGLPRDLETICLKCLAKEPGLRYPTAEALARDLERHLAGEPIGARSLTLPEKLARTVSYSGSPTPLRSWSQVMLLTAPAPVLVALVLSLVFAARPSYPVLCLVVWNLILSALNPLIVWLNRRPLRQVPHRYRRYVWSMTVARAAGWLLVPIVVALMRPGHDLDEFYVVFPLWIFLDGNFWFVLGSDVGIGYLVALIHYAVAVLVTLAPHWSPLVFGTLLSVDQLIDGLCLRSLRE